jgi:hypothetical protein
VRLARKLPPARPLSGLVVHLCGRCGYVGTAEREPDPPPPKWLRPTRGVRYSLFRAALANVDDQTDNEPKTRLICRRCGARTKLARQLPWIDPRSPCFRHRLGACRFVRVARAGGLITTSNPAIEQGGCPGRGSRTRGEARVRPSNTPPAPKVPSSYGAPVQFFEVSFFFSAPLPAASSNPFR